MNKGRGHCSRIDKQCPFLYMNTSVHTVEVDMGGFVLIIHPFHRINPVQVKFSILKWRCAQTREPIIVLCVVYNAEMR